MKLVTTTNVLAPYVCGRSVAAPLSLLAQTPFRHVDLSFYSVIYPGSPWLAPGDGWKKEIEDCAEAAVRYGFDFRQAVWAELLKIPYGKLTTYGAIAQALAQQRGLASVSAQAVGGAVGHNPISILIPCHRVVGAGGSLTGYAGGVARKSALLELEKADLSGCFVPKKGTAL